MLKRFIACTTAACCAALAQAQTTPITESGNPGAAASAPADFSEGGAKPTAAELAQWLTGHVYESTLANGQRWRMDYKSSSGYVFINISNGARDTARWRTEDGKVCFDFRGSFPSGCSEFRVAADRLFFKRNSTGEVVAMNRSP